MAQQARDIYSGLKKIWPTRRGSFCAQDEATHKAKPVAEKQAQDSAGQRRSSFSFAAWMGETTTGKKEGGKWERWRKRSFSFGSISSVKETSRSGKTSTTSKASTMVMDDVATVVKPTTKHVWEDSDSDDEYADTRRPRGLDGRSMSADFDVLPASHLISRVWKKLPMQAKLYGNGSVDLDLQKDRLSFSRSSSVKKTKSTTVERLSVDESNVFNDKHVRFRSRIEYHPSEEEIYVAVESYDDVVVRVCAFGAHDQRPTHIKVQDLLERSMAYIHQRPTKHGNYVSLSNEELRMWRRLARHNWQSEASIYRNRDEASHEEAMTAGTSRKHCDSLSSSTDDSDLEEEDLSENDEDNQELCVPDDAELDAVTEVVNFCVNFGDELFSVDDVEELVRLELLVEEDGWI